jgi:hypothetical protein
MAITLCRTLKPSKQADTRQNVTHCRACNVLLIEHNHGCRLEDLQRVPIQAVKVNKTESVDVVNQLLSDYLKYRELVMELKALPSPTECANCAYACNDCNISDICKTETIEHINGDADDNETDNLTLANDKQTDFELQTSGLAAGQPYVYDKSLSWKDNIRIWEERTPIEYPEGYYQGIELFEDGQSIYKATYLEKKHNFKKLIKFDKIKKTRKSKVGVC